MTRGRWNRRSLTAGGVTLTMLVGVQIAGLSSPATAATTTLKVSSIADVPTDTGACADPSITTAPTDLSLREALCLADNLGGPVVIDLGAGTYPLDNGELAFGKAPGQDVTIQGAGPGSTVIDAQGVSRVFFVDQNLVGGVSATIQGVTLTGGKDNTFGGGAIVAGSMGAAANDTLTVTNAVIKDNATVGPNAPGGGIAMTGGRLVIKNSTVTGNSSNIDGSGVYYTDWGSTAGQSLSVTGSTFRGNSVVNTLNSGNGGGALAVQGGNAGTSFTVDGSTFDSNTAVSAAPVPGDPSSPGTAGVGAAIYQQSGRLTVTHSSFTGNSVTGDGSAGPAIFSDSSMNLHYNRFSGNIGPWTVSTTSTADAAENWWGCNSGPNTALCETTAGGVFAMPRLVLSATASPNPVTGPNGSATITAALTTDSGGASVSPTDLTAFDGTTVTFADPAGDATVSTTPGDKTVPISAGQATIDYHANTTTGPDNVTASYDNASVIAVLKVDQAPAITSPDTAVFAQGQASSFTVTTTGDPAPTLTSTGSLPAGLTFLDNGDGTATISGTTTDPVGAYPITVTAHNETGADAVQTLAVQVGQTPTISTLSPVFTVGRSASYVYTTTGNPPVTKITESGALPGGVTFTDNGDGTATLGGTPTGAGGSYPVTLTAENDLHQQGLLTQTIQVNQAPEVTLDPAAQTVQPGTDVTFTAAASGTPAPTVSWQRSTDHGGTFTDISGAASGTYTLTATAADDGTEYRAVFHNVVGDATTAAAVLRVGAAPALTSADHTTFGVGAAGTFTVTTTPGFPAALTITEQGALPDGVSFVDNGDGTATLSGTPATGQGGDYPLVLVASNGVVPDAQQAFDLVVNEAPRITSADHAASVIGQPGTFTVTSSPSWPTSRTLSETGALPSGVTFTDNGDGTATLSGTPAAGTIGDYTLMVTAANAAGQDVQSLTLRVAKIPQTITVTSPVPSDAVPGTTYTPTATSDSGLPVTVSLDAATPSSVCSLSGGTVTLSAPGDCVIDFDQPGDASHAAAPRVQQTVSVAKVATAVTVSSSASPSVFGQRVHAVATVTSGRGAPSGTVQFSVDGTALGAPVLVSGGTAVSGDLAGPGGAFLTVGSHQVTARFTPSNGVLYADATGTLTQVVDRAATSTGVTVQPDTLTAIVTSLAPGRGTPTGQVTFTVDGQSVGTGTLASGTATLSYTVPKGAERHVAASYAGDGSFTGSSASTVRRDPRITAKLTSSRPKHAGWYRTPVTVTFTCTTNGAPLTGPCPAPVVLGHDGAGQSVTRTVLATDGGVGTVVVNGIDIDQVAPRVHILGVHGGASYPRPPAAHCRASDRLSGVAHCTLTRKVRGRTVTYTARATDRAGNSAVTRVRVRLLVAYLDGAQWRNGAFDVRAGHSYTLVVRAAQQPAYYAAVPAPARPGGEPIGLRRAGHHRWAQGITITRAMRSHRLWNLGVRYGGRLHLVQLRVR